MVELKFGLQGGDDPFATKFSLYPRRVIIFLNMDFWVIRVILLVYFKDEQQVEYAANIKAPMQKQLTKHLLYNEVVDCFLELLTEDEVELIENGEGLLQEE